jgi:DUF1016 N-terminal domain
MTNIPLLKAKLRKALSMPKTGVIWYYRVGCHVLALTKASGYGTACVDDVAGKPGESRATLYVTMKLARKYPGKELDAVRGLPWSVVRALLAVKDDKMRIELQQEAGKERWSARKLQRVINEREGYPERRVVRKLKDKHDGRDLKRLAIATRAWQQVVKNNWPADRLRKLQPGGRKLARLAEQASAAMKALLRAVQSRELPDQKSPSAQP